MNLLSDEMSIMKHLQFFGNKFVGFVDLGEEEDTSELAAECLTFMAVAINNSWKIPLGYFLIKGLTADQRVNLVTDCLKKLHDCGVKVTSMTCDGPRVNLSMLKKLGADLNPDSINSQIQIRGADKPIHVLLDNCHMLKNCRNAWEAYDGEFVDGDGGVISWKYIILLYEFQTNYTFHAGNRLRRDHVYFHNQIMKVSFAAQTFSRSVANAIDHCRENLKLPEFKDSAPTSKFLRKFDELFDLCNSSSKFGKWSKAPLTNLNTGYWKDVFECGKSYILGLHLATGKQN